MIPVLAQEAEFALPCPFLLSGTLREIY